MFSGSPIKRTGRNRFVRNVLIAAGNSGDVALLEKVTALLDDEDSGVRGAAIWALGEIDAARFAFEKAARAYGETDADVKAEWGGV
jgi:epoxyqueuosine reductase